MAYVDTSVLAAYYCPEALSDAAARELQSAADRLISPLVEVELISALAVKTRTRHLAIADARAILARFRSHSSQGLFSIVEIGAREYTAAVQWLETFAAPLRALDALHLAAAFVNRQTLLTADLMLAKSARLLGVKFKLIR